MIYKTLEEVICTKLDVRAVYRPCWMCGGRGWRMYSAYHNDSVKGKCDTCHAKHLFVSHYEDVESPMEAP